MFYLSLLGKIVTYISQIFVLNYSEKHSFFVCYVGPVNT